MSIEIKEEFEVDAPIERVWDLVMDPHEVVTCLPGASLDEVVDERTFDGSIKVKVGAVMAAYKGRVEMTEVDEAGRTVRMSAEGKEKGGGTAKGYMVSRLTPTDSGGTKVVAEANVDLTGKIMQVGRGMIQGVSHQIFLQFVKKIRKKLESEEATAATASSAPPSSDAAAAAPAPGTSAPPPAVEEDDEAIAIVPILLKTIWAGIVGFFRRLFGGGK